MNPERKRQWVAALRSGRYPQGRGRLNSNGRYCCLGVLCDQAAHAGVVEAEPAPFNAASPNVAYDGCDGLPPDAVVEWAGLDQANPVIPVSPGSLAVLNDEGVPFEEIADLIEEYL